MATSAHDGTGDVGQTVTADGRTGIRDAWRRGELLAWSAVARVLVARVSLARAIRLLDALPRRGRESPAIAFPTDRQVRLAGACLGRSLARSQYLRTHGVPHRLVIGAAGGSEGFRAHAWIAPYEPVPEDFVELRSIAR